MFYSAGTILWAFVAMFGGIFLAQPIGKRGYRSAGDTIMWGTLLAALYLVGTGIHMAIDWQDPFADKDPAEMARSIHNPKGWILVWLFRIWPYVQVAFAGLYAFAIGRALVSRPRARA